MSASGSSSASPDGRVRIGVALNDHLLTGDGAERRRIVARVEDAELDHLTVGDHVSFHGGTGFDGLVNATALLATTDRLEVLIGVYLLGLRHPMLAARSVATLAQLAPGRLILGAGVAGEDRSEISNSGVDPATRGRRLDETIDVLQRLLAGETVDHAGEFFALRGARILPVPEPSVPLVIGGRGGPAIERTARAGDGWLGIFCTPRRYGETVRAISARAAALGRAPSWFGLNLWCGLAATETDARARLAAELQSVYRLPYERFEHVTVAGAPEQVAERLAAYVEQGARHLTLIPAAGSADACVDLVAEVARLVRGGRA